MRLPGALSESFSGRAGCSRPNMSGTTGSPKKATASDAEDPIVPIFHEHNELQVLATRFHEVASQLERGESVPASEISAGVEVHRRFLVEVHHAREAEIAAAVRPTAPPAVIRALDRCGTVHAEATRFEEEARALLGKGSIPAERRKAIALAFHKEAERMLEHHKEEDETIYRPIHHALTPEVHARLVRAMHALSGKTAAAQELLTGWTSHRNPSSD